MKYVNKPSTCTTPLHQRGGCDEKGLPSTPYDPCARSASHLLEDAIHEIHGHVYQNEFLSICKAFSARPPRLNATLRFTEITLAPFFRAERAVI
jgi:hypothetical protein